MDFAKSDIQTMLLDSAERLLGSTSGLEYWRDQRQTPGGFDEARWAQFAEMGWLALPLPGAAGGLDGTLEDVALLNIALGKALAKEPYASTVVLASHVLSEAGDSAVGVLAEIGVGTLRVALAHQETGKDPLAYAVPKTSARRHGDGFVISGAKILAMDAPSAGSLIVSAQLDGDDDGIALFLVPCAAAGVALDVYPLIDGSRAADVRFTNVELPSAALLTGGNLGATLLRAAVDRASIALMAQAVGAMEEAVKICAHYTAERKQFGAAIGSFQAIQHIMADMFVAAHQARSMLYHALAHADSDEAERSAALSAARIVIGNAGQVVSRQGVQVHGGYGLTDEYAISHYFRRLMSLEKQYGDLAFHTERFGATLFA